ncbi:hypothetical protein N9B10_07340 [Pirellulales bacterium]|nr:hypothetical protein [Pirellulales bacterium]
MNKQELNITIDPECPDEIKANGIAWVEDACNWLLSQPRTPDATQPRFSEIKITIKPCGFSRGLRDVRDGRGSLVLDTGTDLKFNILPSIIVIPTTQEIAFRSNAVHTLSQLFRPDGWEEHLHYQLKFLDRLAASSKAARGVLDQYEEQQPARKKPMNLNLQFHESLPLEYHEMAKRCLENAIHFLDSQPRPQGIDNLKPQWELMKFTIGEIFPCGRYLPSTMEGWVHQLFRTNGDLVLNSEPLTVITNVDLEIANTCSMVGHLDGVYYLGLNTESQLTRQLSYLDHLAKDNREVRSLLDDYQQQQAAKKEEERLARYRAQFPLKHQQYKDALARSRKITYPDWWLKKYPDANPEKLEDK